MNNLDKISTARFYASHKAPYFTSGLMALTPLESKAVPTMGVTKSGILLWNPDFVGHETMTVMNLAAVLIHELMHILGNHHDRCQRNAFDPKLFNIAADCEINDDIREILDLPGEPYVGVFPETYGFDAGKTAEEYYLALREMSEEEQQQGGQPECGSGAGNPGEGEPDEGEGEDGEGSEAEGYGRTEAELEGLRREVAAGVQEEAAKGTGTIPAGLSRWADSVLVPPKVNWRSKLARAVRSAIAFRAGSVNYRYDRPSRRQAAFGINRIGQPVMPALRRPVPQIGIGVDTSGSMGQSELSDAVRESAGILSAVGAEVSFISCDAAATIGKVRSVNELEKLFVGGGGTDFRPVFRAVPELKPRPEIFVFITDGGGPAPAAPPPGVHVIWLLVGSHRMRPWVGMGEDGWDQENGSVTWGEFIECDDADA